MAGWVFEREPPMGGASTGAWLNPLTGAGLTTEEALVREAIQNSCDAAPDMNSNVLMRFSRTELSGVEARTFGESLQIGELTDRLQRLGLMPRNSLEKLSDATEPSVSLLYIEDFGTAGLGGRLKEGSGPDDRFRRLCLLLGVEDTAEESEHRGGSFGYGKSVYASGSDIRTVVFYSLFEPDESTDWHSARLFTCSFFGPHSRDNRNFTGRAWFGDPDMNGEDCWPLHDENAHEMAERLGFARRSETGTSILVIGSEATMQNLRTGIETYWWPRIRDQDLTIELFENGVQVEPPRPLLRQDLKPFLRCYEVISGRAEPDAEAGESLRTFNRERGYELGHLALKKVDRTPADTIPTDDEETSELLKYSVALVRGLRMVVEYLRAASDYLEPVVGVFVASEDVQSTLRLSEPPPHNRWDPDSRRLDDRQAYFVRTILRRIERSTRDFQRLLQPPPPPSTNRVSTLENLLAKYMRSSLTTHPPPPRRAQDPLQIHIEQQRVESAGFAEIEAVVSLSLKPDSEINSAEAHVQLRMSLVANDNQTVDEAIPVERIEILTGLGTVNIASGELNVVLRRNEPLRISLKSAPFDLDCIAGLSVGVEAQAGEQQ